MSDRSTADRNADSSKMVHRLEIVAIISLLLILGVTFYLSRPG